MVKHSQDQPSSRIYSHGIGRGRNATLPAWLCRSNMGNPYPFVVHESQPFISPFGSSSSSTTAATSATFATSTTSTTVVSNDHESPFKSWKRRFHSSQQMTHQYQNNETSISSLTKSTALQISNNNPTSTECNKNNVKRALLTTATTTTTTTTTTNGQKDNDNPLHVSIQNIEKKNPFSTKDKYSIGSNSSAAIIPNDWNDRRAYLQPLREPSKLLSEGTETTSELQNTELFENTDTYETNFARKQPLKFPTLQTTNGTMTPACPQLSHRVSANHGTKDDTQEHFHLIQHDSLHDSVMTSRNPSHFHVDLFIPPTTRTKTTIEENVSFYTSKLKKLIQKRTHSIMCGDDEDNRREILSCFNTLQTWDSRPRSRPLFVTEAEKEMKLVQEQATKLIMSWKTTDNTNLSDQSAGVVTASAEKNTSISTTENGCLIYPNVSLLPSSQQKVPTIGMVTVSTSASSTLNTLQFDKYKGTRNIGTEDNNKSYDIVYQEQFLSSHDGTNLSPIAGFKYKCSGMQCPNPFNNSTTTSSWSCSHLPASHHQDNSDSLVISQTTSNVSEIDVKEHLHGNVGNGIIKSYGNKSSTSSIGEHAGNRTDINQNDCTDFLQETLTSPQVRNTSKYNNEDRTKTAKTFTNNNSIEDIWPITGIDEHFKTSKVSPGNGQAPFTSHMSLSLGNDHLVAMGNIQPEIVPLPSVKPIIDRNDPMHHPINNQILNDHSHLCVGNAEEKSHMLNNVAINDGCSTIIDYCATNNNIGQLADGRNIQVSYRTTGKPMKQVKDAKLAEAKSKVLQALLAKKKALTRTLQKNALPSNTLLREETDRLEKRNDSVEGSPETERIALRNVVAASESDTSTLDVEPQSSMTLQALSDVTSPDSLDQKLALRKRKIEVLQKIIEAKQKRQALEVASKKTTTAEQDEEDVFANGNLSHIQHVTSKTVNVSTAPKPTRDELLKRKRELERKNAIKNIKIIISKYELLQAKQSLQAKKTKDQLDECINELVQLREVRRERENNLSTLDQRKEVLGVLLAEKVSLLVMKRKLLYDRNANMPG